MVFLKKYRYYRGIIIFETQDFTVVQKNYNIWEKMEINIIIYYISTLPKVQMHMCGHLLQNRGKI